jgi:hypothetical protein
MSWLVPSALVVAGVAALVAIALHFIARSRPLAEPLPTARFIPQRPVRARTRSFALNDLLLLLIRLLVLGALGAAVAGPVFATARARVERIVLVDRSRAVANIAEVRDSVRSLARPGDVLIAFDSAATMVRSVDSLARVPARGSLSAALAAALREAGVIAKRADSVELVVVSPLVAGEIDEATNRIRDVWVGRIRPVRVRAESDSGKAFRLMADASTDDPVVAGLALRGLIGSGEGRLIRGRVTAADSAWVRGGNRLLVHWPSSDTATVWPARTSIDAIGGVSSATGSLVSRFPRLWRLEGEAIARWADGEPAAVERAAGSGCIRDVGLLLDPSSDIALREPFGRFVQALVAPCGGNRNATPMNDAWIAQFSGTGGLASAEIFRDRASGSSAWTPWLLAAAALLLIVELLARRSERSVAR